MPVRTLLPVAAPGESSTITIQIPALALPLIEIQNPQYLRSSRDSTKQSAGRAPHNPATHPPSSAKSSKPVIAHQLLLTLYPRLAISPSGRKSRNSAPPIAEHWHRPHVLASDRLFFWTSDAAIQKRIQLLSSLSPADVEAYDLSLLTLISLSTRQIYGAGLMEWIVYCDSRRIPEHHRFPAEPHHLQAFIASHSGSIGVSKLNNILSALALWHQIHELPWDGLTQPLTKRFKRNAIARAPSDSSQPPRSPVTLRHLDLLAQSIDLTQPFDSAMWATACCAFWGVCRLGELTSPALNDPDPTHRARRSSSNFAWTSTSPQSAACPPDGANWAIPWTKTTGFTGATIIISRWNHGSCPVRALANHFHVNQRLPPDATFFAYSHPSSPAGWSPMIKSVFMKRCTEIWKTANVPKCTGHSFRIGGATQLIEQGVSFDWVCMQGRWSSDAWRRYVRSTPRLLQLEIARLRRLSSSS